MVREALEAAKVAVTTAQDTISVNSSAASALTAASIAKRRLKSLMKSFDWNYNEY